MSALERLAQTMTLGNLLDALRDQYGSFEIVNHWQQGEFHHDLVFRLPCPVRDMPGEILVVSSNCNGGIKELLCFAQAPTHESLWQERCFENAQSHSTAVLARARTVHWFDPCELMISSACT